MRTDRFRAARENKGLGIRDLARVLGISAAAVSNWQNGKTKPKPDMLNRVAELLDVSPEHLDNTLNVDFELRQSKSVSDVLSNARHDLANIMGVPEARIFLEVRLF